MTDRPSSGAEEIRIAITQVEYSMEPDGPVIHIFGRSGDKTSHHLQVTGYRPYFYIPAEEVLRAEQLPQVTVETGRTYQTIRGEQVRRVFTSRPTDVRDVREGFHHYEADIPFASRFLIDRGIRGGVVSPSRRTPYSSLQPTVVDVPSRICMLDIECEDVRGFPQADRDAVICVTCWDSFDDMYTTFVISPDTILKEENADLPAGCFLNGHHEVVTCPDERSLLKALGSFIRTKDPDIFSGWNIAEFDLPYLVGRLQAQNLDPQIFARIPGTTERTPARGRTIFDLLTGYKKMQGAQRDSYRLDAIAEYELGETKFRYTGLLYDLLQTRPRQLVAYNYKDVELCVRINQKNNIIDFYQEIARYVGMPLEKTLNSSNIIDIYILRKAHGLFVLPSKGFASGEEFEGATVFEPSIGIKENVVVLDLTSLYPMAMMTINASPETKDPNGDLFAPNGIRFMSEPDGLTRSIISELLAERDARKNLRNQYPFGSNEYKLYDIQQNVIKVIMNTYYGVSGYARFRLYDREIGSAVTSVGRAIIDHTRGVIEAQGYSVIYGDTDSCMVQLPPHMDLEETISTARRIESQVNQSYAQFALTVLHAKKHYFSIKFEKVFRRFFQAGKKKRYAGHLVWKEGKGADQIDVVGFELRRSDSPPITREVQRTVMDLVLRGAGYDSVKKYLGDVIKKYRAGEYRLEEIGIPGGIGKNLNDYENDDAHVRGAKYSNTYLGMEFAKGSKPKRVYIKNVTARFPKTDVICFEYGDQVPKEFLVDRELMLEKTIKQPISRILEGLGWHWADVDPSRTTLFDFGL